MFMKNIIFKTLLLILIFIFHNPNIYSQISYSFAIHKEDLIITTITGEDKIIYNKIFIKDFRLISEQGKPNLPVKYLRLIVPSEQDVKDIKVNVESKEKISLDYQIYPAQPDIPTSIDYQKPDFIKPDYQIYQSDNPYPEEIANVIHSGYFDGTGIR